MYTIGQKIKILEPFNLDEQFQGEFTIKEINETDTFVLLEEVEFAFDFKYIEGIQ